jgi:CheY-like chemotaxis protein
MILLDLMMPEMNGWDFLSFKGTDPRLAAIPVVVMTAAPQSAPRNVKVLQKPALARTIVEAVKCCCSGRPKED